MPGTNKWKTLHKQTQYKHSRSKHLLRVPSINVSKHLFFASLFPDIVLWLHYTLVV